MASGPSICTQRGGVQSQGRTRSRWQGTVFTANWLSVPVLAAAVTAGLVYRIRVEERALLRDLGDRYATYAASHKRLVPFVW